jgi:hypothetical protein
VKMASELLFQLSGRWIVGKCCWLESIGRKVFLRREK